ncbi:50S ribosomal protein L9 [Candidatus Dependentiae bacterium]|nr:MAG: 50S ribosomal protein L9 [Candidatus Dependentiae bacterium]
MYILLKQDIEKIGMQGNVVKVADGYAVNFLVPKNLAVIIQESELKMYQNRQKKESISKEVLNSKLGMLAERIKVIKLTIKKRSHDDGKLYGSVSTDDVVAALKEKDIKINKKQVSFERTIRSTGEYTITIKLTSKIVTNCHLNVTGK